MINQLLYEEEISTRELGENMRYNGNYSNSNDSNDNAMNKWNLKMTIVNMSVGVSRIAGLIAVTIAIAAVEIWSVSYLYRTF